MARSPKKSTARRSAKPTLQKPISLTEASSERPVVIELENLRRTYGQGDAAVHALAGIDLVVTEGEFVSLMGPSGSGKSTCMNILGCLDSPTSGLYFFSGVNVADLSNKQRALLRRNYLGFVFQGFNLLSRTTALENAELPLVYRGVPKAERHTLAEEALRAVGLGDRLHHTPGELSGGQQQRVAIARAIVTRPIVLLADEPTGNLDTARSIETMQLLQSFNREQGITIVMVTHEPEMAEYSDRIIHFRDGQIEREEKV